MMILHSNARFIMTDQQVTWNKERVQLLLDRNDAAVAKAVLTIFARQTSAEQAQNQTVEHNGVGFSGRDAEFLSDIAKKLPLYNMRMTPRQMTSVRRSIKKYWRQLLQEIEAKGGSVSYKIAKTTKSPISEIAQTPSPYAGVAGYGSF
jgi:hypothetical protein